VISWSPFPPQARGILIHQGCLHPCTTCVVTYLGCPRVEAIKQPQQASAHTPTVHASTICAPCSVVAYLGCLQMLPSSTGLSTRTHIYMHPCTTRGTYLGCLWKSSGLQPCRPWGAMGSKRMPGPPMPGPPMPCEQHQRENHQGMCKDCEL
jgi:hypothetical protein